MLRQSDLHPNEIDPEDIFEIQEDFRIFKKMSAGAYYTVFKAYSYYNDSVCALMIIPNIDRNGRDRHAIIENEIRILEGLRHRFILRSRTHEAYLHTTCIILEFCDPQYDLLQGLVQSRIRGHMLQRYIIDIGTTLDYMHRRNIIHRNLQLENILISSRGDIKITGFWLAAFASPLGSASGRVGPPWARAPEMLTQRFYNKAVDWWSLGIILFTMITREQPF
ncbi:kinase-like domain-containing protein, partial [Melampsora americana]